MESFIIFTYSSASADRLKDLFSEIVELFGLSVTLDDMFWVGVFCGISQYVGTPEMNSEISGIPAILVSSRTPYGEKEDYVKSVINSVMMGETEKPEWMIEIEQSDRCGRYSPSTYLYLLPKEDTYKRLGDKIISFLYSVGIEVENKKCAY